MKLFIAVLLYTSLVNSQVQDNGLANQGLPAIAAGFANVVVSSEWDANHGASHIRLDYTTRDGSSSWCAAANDANQWVIVNFGFKPVRVSKIVTQGRGNYDQWVTSFKVQFSQDGVFFSDVENGRTFTGNNDRNTKVTTVFNQIVFARILRIVPVTFFGHISMRLEAYISDSASF